jgi:hypothetical protein
MLKQDEEEEEGIYSPWDTHWDTLRKRLKKLR